LRTVEGDMRNLSKFADADFDLVFLAARTPRSFGHKALRAALDSSPLWGAGRVEDTYNLLGHDLKKALGVIASQQGRGLAEVATEAGASLLCGTSLKAALDLD